MTEKELKIQITLGTATSQMIKEFDFKKNKAGDTMYPIYIIDFIWRSGGVLYEKALYLELVDKEKQLVVCRKQKVEAKSGSV